MLAKRLHPRAERLWRLGEPGSRRGLPALALPRISSDHAGCGHATSACGRVQSGRRGDPQQQQVPAIIGIGFVIGIQRRLVTGPRPSGLGILRAQSQRAMNANHRAEYRLIPPCAPRSQLVQEVPQGIGDYGSPAGMLVAPTIDPVTMGRIGAQWRATQAEVPQVLWGVDEEYAADEQCAEAQPRTAVAPR
jgi:hypothetical protein